MLCFKMVYALMNTKYPINCQFQVTGNFLYGSIKNRLISIILKSTSACVQLVKSCNSRVKEDHNETTVYWTVVTVGTNQRTDGMADEWLSHNERTAVE